MSPKSPQELKTNQQLLHFSWKMSIHFCCCHFVIFSQSIILYLDPVRNLCKHTDFDCPFHAPKVCLPSSLTALYCLTTSIFILWRYSESPPTLVISSLYVKQSFSKQTLLKEKVVDSMEKLSVSSHWVLYTSYPVYKKRKRPERRTKDKSHCVSVRWVGLLWLCR